MSNAAKPDQSESQLYTQYVEHLSDEDLNRLNELLPWQCYTLDGQGRQFGMPASTKKRASPQKIPDSRIVELDRRLPLKELSVLEIGCFEGIHSIALAQRARRVIAVDSRIENVLKTIVRTWSFGHHVTCFKCDVELESDFRLIPQVDVSHHVGVLYHLKDPVAHLRSLLPKTRQMLMLDTHVAAEGEAQDNYEVDGKIYPYRRFDEGGRKDAFSGMYDHAKWLPLDTLTTLILECGFSDIDVAQVREERNGLRVLIYAKR